MLFDFLFLLLLFAILLLESFWLYMVEISGSVCNEFCCCKSGVIGVSIKWLASLTDNVFSTSRFFRSLFQGTESLSVMMLLVLGMTPIKDFDTPWRKIRKQLHLPQ